jgi:hypothetical protein
MKDTPEAKAKKVGPHSNQNSSSKNPLSGAVSMGPKIKTSTTMTIDALIMTIPSTLQVQGCHNDKGYTKRHYNDNECKATWPSC